MARHKKKIGEILIENGLIGKQQLDHAIEEQKVSNGKIASIINLMGSADEESIASELGKQLGLQYITLEGRTIPPDVIKIVSADLAKKYCMIPVESDNRNLTVAMTNPTDLTAIDEISFTLGMKIKPLLALEHSIRMAQARHYDDISYSPPSIKKMESGKPSGEMEIERFDSVSPVQPYPVEDIMEAVADILIEKNIISRTEIFKKLRKRSRPSSEE